MPTSIKIQAKFYEILLNVDASNFFYYFVNFVSTCLFMSAILTLSNNSG